MFNIKEQLKTLPDKPGVYIMKDNNDKVIYVGKAKVLKDRVRQYFRSSKNHSLKVQSMVSHIAEFEYIITDSETEALVLECNLIKKYMPKYNVLLKDDKTYPYIKVTLNEAYPRVMITRKIEKDGAKYFGPYTNFTAVKETIHIIKKVFTIRTCNRQLPRDIGKLRPCLNYHIKQCYAPCQGYISKEAYRETFKDICSFLSGKQDMLIEKLTTEMYKASENMDFEKAAKVRDQINSIKQVSQKQKIVSSSLIDQDIIALETDNNTACAQVFFIRGGKLIGREHFIIDDVLHMQESEVITSFVKQFYNKSSYIPKEIILQNNIDEEDIIQRWLTDKRGSKVYIIIPQKGEKKKLIQMVRKNAQDILNNHILKVVQEKNFIQQSLEQLKESLLLDNIPKRIEAYDISNISGTQSVGAMVVFENSKSLRKDYRMFKIKTVKGSDDYESMREVLSRRLNAAKRQDDRSFSTLPDIILIDGGKGHVNAIKQVLDNSNVTIPVFGMVKDDRHRTRGLVTEDLEINLSLNTEAFKLITQIQDEVHRFAINYHRKLRSKELIKSELEEIEGIGSIRIKALLKHFKSIDKIRVATIDQIQDVDGMNKRVAENVYNYFRR